MKVSMFFSKISLAVLAIMVLNSCKKDNSEVNNLAPFRKEDSQAQVLDITTVNTDMVLEDRVNGVDYMITHNIAVNANLTIKAGVTLMFEDGAGIQVNEGGSITAIGAHENEVLFTSKSGKRGSWKGVTILSSNARNVLSFCKVEQAGGDNTFGAANVTIGSGSHEAMAEVSNCEITASNTDGILISRASTVPNFTANNIHTNTGYPVNMHVADAANLKDGNVFASNGNEFIKIVGNDNEIINQPITLKKLSEPFLLSGLVTSTNAFTIEPGARIMMDNSAHILIDGSSGNAYLNAIGTASQPISITSVFTGSGVWNAIQFRASKSAKNQIEFCNISGGGAASGANTAGMVSVAEQSSAIIRNNSIMNSAASGVYIQNPGSACNTDIVTSNTFANNAKGNIQIN